MHQVVRTSVNHINPLQNCIRSINPIIGLPPSRLHAIGLYALHKDRQFGQVLICDTPFRLEQALHNCFSDLRLNEGFPAGNNIATFVCQPGVRCSDGIVPLHDYTSLLRQVSRSYFDQAVGVTLTYAQQPFLYPLEIVVNDSPDKSFYCSCVDNFKPHSLQNLFNP